ncbi:MAG: radical SAM protein, partial [Lentisphaeraceae bacterium]|nr:radical SAM protein [Lentisphaeraceae bacterium]
RDRILILKTFVRDELFNDHETGIGHYVKRNYLLVESCYILESGNRVRYSIEETMAKSLALQNLQDYSSIRPRSISYLPIAQGCQASCSFCFSKASVSDDIKAQTQNNELLRKQLEKAKAAGAERAVITGGGEPTLLPEKKLLKVIEEMNNFFEKVVLISNGYWLAIKSEVERLKSLKSLYESGLGILALSRHHYDDELNEKIMNLKIEIRSVLGSVKELNTGLVPRLICVLQRGGIENAEDIEKYLSFAAENNVDQVCFKELYVSTSTESYYHTYESNIWSKANQVPLSVLTAFLEQNGSKAIGRLPWGAPVYEYKIADKLIKVAAYTEPSLYWERVNAVARSWNIMSDGTVLASLEDRKSLVHP